MRSGTALTQLVEFSDGFPDGDVEWQVLDGHGSQVASGSVVPVAESVSVVLTISALENELEAGAVASPRELSWAYTVGGLVHTGRRRYRLEAFLPFGVSEEGVRTKLGLEPHELEDDAIDLVSAYGQFVETVGADPLLTVTGYQETKVCDAIEALAAIAILPSLQVKLAMKQSSGTDQFQRGAIDWAALRAQLDNIVTAGITTVNPNFSETGTFGSLLVVVVREDPVTNTTP